MHLAQLGEFGLIDLLTRNFSYGPGVIQGVGDDAAVLEARGDKSLLFTTDMMVEDIHFSFDYSTAAQVGWKLLAVNVSDIAAMGGCPTHALIAASVPPDKDPELLVAIYQGLQEAARAYGVNLVGGDTVSGCRQLVLNLALLGEVAVGKAVYRSGAHPGDAVYVTGPLGAAAAGLYSFQHPDLSCSPQAAAYCRERHAAPKPRLDAGCFLAGYGINAMNDISDGLANEMHEICQTSGVGCLLWETSIPLDRRVTEVAACSGVEPLQWVFGGGEDFELVFTVNPAAQQELERSALAAGIRLYHVGVTTESSELLLEKTDGTVVPLKRGGYEHFG